MIEKKIIKKYASFNLLQFENELYAGSTYLGDLKLNNYHLLFIIGFKARVFHSFIYHALVFEIMRTLLSGLENEKYVGYQMRLSLFSNAFLSYQLLINFCILDCKLPGVWEATNIFNSSGLKREVQFTSEMKCIEMIDLVSPTEME